MTLEMMIFLGGALALYVAGQLTGHRHGNHSRVHLSDKYEGYFNAEDEKHFVAFADLVSTHLEAPWDLHNSRKQMNR